MKYRVVHKTEYRYGASVSLCHNLAHLRPRNLPTQQCLGHRLQIDPLPMDLAEHEDFFGNHVSYFSIQQPHEVLTVTATSEMQLDPASQLPLGEDMPWDTVRRLLAQVPEADTISLQVMLRQAEYLRAEESVAKWMEERSNTALRDQARRAAGLASTGESLSRQRLRNLL